MIRAFILLGGFVGPDGPALSLGMIRLAVRLNALSTVKCSWHCWSRYIEVVSQIANLPRDCEVALIGYSGGGTRAIFAANALAPRKIKLLVLYDPSPRWQILPISGNVERAICYWNTRPMFFGFGGGKPNGAEIIEIAENHALVQMDERLHRVTVEALNELSSRVPRVRSA